MDCESLTPTQGATQQSVDCESPTPTQKATQQSVGCESLTPTRGATQQSVDCESLTPTRGATQQSVDCESLTPTRGATQQSVDCESLTPTNNLDKKKSGSLRTALQRGTKPKPEVANPPFSGGQKRAEVRRHPCILGGPQGQKSEVAHRWAHCLQACIFSKIGNCFFAVRSCNFFYFCGKCV